MAARIECSGLVKRYGALEVIHGIDLAIEPGEFVVFVGPSGCGKSTLLRMIAGLEPISDGKLIVDGEIINTVAPADRGIAMVFQSYALYPHMTVYKNLAFGLETMGEPRAVVREKVERAADILQIRSLLDRKPKQLSGGQRQRVAIGRAIVREPRIFLFDEPLSNLDAELRVQMRVEIAELHAQLKNTMIYVTHDQVEAMTMADKIVILKDGHIMQAGPPLELYNNPANRFVAGFIGSPSMNFFDVEVLANDDSGLRIRLDGNEIDFGPRRLKANTGDRIALGVRPEHVAVAPGAGMLRLASLRVRLHEHLGAQTLIYSETEGGQRATVTLNTQEESAQRIEGWVDPTKVHFFAPDGERL